MIFISLLVVAVASLLMGAVVFANNTRAANNRAYGAFSVFSALWMIANAVALDSNQLNLALQPRLFATQLIVIFASFSALFFLLFTQLFCGFDRTAKQISILLTSMSLVINSMVFTEHFYYIKGNGIVTGDWYWIFAFSIAAYMVATARTLFIKKNKHGDVMYHKQIDFLQKGYLLSVIPSFIFGGILASYSSSDVPAISPVFLIFFLSYAATAIVRHKLFDVRAIVARTLTYVMTISLIGIAYATIVFTVGGTLLNIESVNNLQRALFALMALMIAVTYGPIIKFFNRMTTKLFYRDAYDTQVVLDQIGKIIVGSIDLHKIEKSALRVLAEALRPTYTGFVLKSTTGGINTQDFIGEAPRFKSEELAKTLSMISKHEVVYDELEQSNELAQLMRVNDISFITPLITKSETIGYLISGPKKSGNIYSQQDKSMVTIASNELAVALQNAQRFDEIQAFNITLQEKVTEATRELKISNKKLIQLDEAKDEFISMASHQLRTPLTSIKGYLSMLVEGDLGKLESQQEKALKEAFGSSQRMVYLIADFLNVSRIKTGKFVIETKEVNLPEIVKEELSQLIEMASSKGLILNYEKPGVFPAVKLDDNKIRQVMMNIIDNAIYYTPAGGVITMQLYSTSDDVIFKVIDNGIGVPKAEQHKLFTKFYRARNAKKARPDGTGLGLFMAQKIVVEQGGAIIFESTEGKGSTFGFRFPLKKIKA